MDSMKIENELILENSEQLNILYVEDNELLRNATKNIFLIYFKGVDTAIDGREGLEKFLLHQYAAYERNRDVRSHYG